MRSCSGWFVAGCLLGGAMVLSGSAGPLQAAPPLAGVTKQQFHLYLLAGQSNMAGRGKPTAEDTTPQRRIFMLNQQDQWVAAKEPLHFDKPRIAGVGPGFAFARAMAQADPDAVIGLIPCAFGGTSLQQWAPESTDRRHLYATAVRRTKLAMADGVLKAILWHQGESDSNDEKTARSYGDRLERIVDAFRRDLDAATVPFVCGELGRFFVKHRPFAQIVNTQLKYFPLRVRLAACVSSAGLARRDGAHFNRDGTVELGRRYARAVRRLSAMAMPKVVRLWPAGLPTGKPLAQPEVEERFRVRNVSDPRFEWFAAPPEIATGAAVVVCPGGGYSILAIDLEGRNVARWLNKLGISAAVLKYRLKQYPQPAPLTDAQQAIRILRKNADRWRLDTTKIGIMGFSAGGHLAGYASTSEPICLKGTAYEAWGAIDCRPNFSLLIYGVLPQRQEKRWSGGMYALLSIDKKTPPAFLVQCKDDFVPVHFAIEYAGALRKQGIAHELHVYETGGHGFGLGKRGGEVAGWPQLAAAWLVKRGLARGHARR